MPFLIELVFVDVAELRHIYGDLPLHPLPVPALARAKTDDLDTTRTLAPLPAGPLTLGRCDDLRGLVTERRGSSLGLTFVCLHKLRGEPAVAEFVLEALSVFLILQATVAVAASL